ncbi:MAG: hypothetical protein V3U83_04635, partial [Acidobacteriota bacterium]
MPRLTSLALTLLTVLYIGARFDPIPASAPDASNAGLRDPGQGAVYTAVGAHLRLHEREILGELVDLLTIPNLATDGVNIEKNAGRLEAMLRARGITTKRLEVEGAPPVVFGELRAPGATRTV